MFYDFVFWKVNVTGHVKVLYQPKLTNQCPDKYKNNYSTNTHPGFFGMLWAHYFEAFTVGLRLTVVKITEHGIALYSGLVDRTK